MAVKPPPCFNLGSSAFICGCLLKSAFRFGRCLIMQLGFVSAIVAELSLEQVAELAAAEGFDCVELMCWPTGKAERRYAGVTHVDVAGITADDARRVREIMAKRNVAISGLGYYPNPLAADREESHRAIEHLTQVIAAA